MYTYQIYQFAEESEVLARAFCACSRCGWGLLDIFTLLYPFSLLSPSLAETARYSVVVTSPKLTLIARLIGEVHSNILAYGIPYADFCAFLLRRI